MKLNTILGGEENQTFSARNYERKRLGLFNVVWLIDLLTTPNHCLIAWVNWITTKEKNRESEDLRAREMFLVQESKEAS